MKNKNVLVIILAVIILVALSIGIFYYFSNRRIYELNLPELENLQSISLKQDENEKIFSDSDKIKEILDIIGGVKSKIKKESIQDYPVNVVDAIKVNFNFIGRGASTLFVYEKNNKYYIEQPYNGVYQISADEYDLIEKYVK